MVVAGRRATVEAAYSGAKGWRKFPGRKGMLSGVMRK